MRKSIAFLIAASLAGAVSAADAEASSCGSNFLATMIACPLCGKQAASATRQCFDDQKARHREARCAEMSSWSPEYHDLRVAQVRYELSHGRGQRSALWRTKYTEYIELAERCPPTQTARVEN